MRCSPGRPRRSIKPLNACRMAVGNVLQADLQPWAACTPIGILSVNPIPPGKLRYVLLYSSKVTHMKKTSTLIMILAMMPAAAAVLSANDALDDELISAAREGDSALVEALLDQGADIESRIFGRTALMYASIMGRSTVVETLLDRGAALEARDNSERSALMWASGEGQVAVAATLLDRGAALEARDDRGYTALMYASITGQAAVVETLLNRGVDINARND